MQNMVKYKSMKKFKKRTIALVLASVITVAGSYAEENFKNTLMGIDFLYDRNGSGALSLVLKTRNKYYGNVIPTKRDENTYMLLLPEVNSMVKMPDMSKYQGRVENITINTLPYTTHGNGYTKIVIHTQNVPAMFGQNMIYIPESQNTTTRPVSKTVQAPVKTVSQKTISQIEIERRINEQEKLREQEAERQLSQIEASNEEDQSNLEETKQEQEVVQESSKKINVNDLSEENSIDYMQKSSKSSESFMLILGIFLILSCCIFLWVKAKNKLTEIAGESLQLDLSEEDDNKKIKQEKKTTKIKKAINSYDAKYTHKPVSKSKDYNIIQDKPKEIKTVEEEMNVVDLDELFKEKNNNQQIKEKTTEEEENLALEEFLSGFSFDEEVYEEQIDDGYDIEFYEELIKRTDIIFTEEDNNNINKLLQSEITDSTLKDMENYLVSNPIKRKRSKKEILEEFVTTYAVSQSISFTPEDINALEKLMSVEIDQDFLENLKLNPERKIEMDKEIKESSGASKKTSRPTVLKVKDMLPDLSEALKKQGGKEIKSEAKATTVYFSEGYDVKTLSIASELPDLSKELKKESAYKSKPSASYQIVDNTYEVETLSLSDQLPDLKDALAHPEKYQKEEPAKVEVDEKALLDNISNVSFKPFYDGSQNFEVINNVEDFDNNSNSEGETFIDLDEIKLDKENLVVSNNQNQKKPTKDEEIPTKELIKLERKVPSSNLRNKSKEKSELFKDLTQKEKNDIEYTALKERENTDF